MYRRECLTPEIRDTLNYWEAQEDKRETRWDARKTHKRLDIKRGTIKPLNIS